MNLYGKTVYLIPVEVDDAKFILNLLTNENLNKYLSPTGYRKTGIVQDENKTKYDWNEVTLCNMLKNEVYIGNTV